MVSDDSLISVADAAGRLGVSARRVRALVASRAVAARRVGGVWLVDRMSVEQRALRGPGPGRRLSPGSAWAILAVLDGREPLVGSRAEAGRARRRAARVRAEGLEPGALASRAGVYRFRAHPGVLARLGADGALVAAGVQAARVHGADIVSLEVDGYLRADDLDRVVRQYALTTGGDANVTLRVPIGGWPFAGAVVPAVVCAADLVDAGDERSVRAGRALLVRSATEQ